MCWKGQFGDRKIKWEGYCSNLGLFRCICIEYQYMYELGVVLGIGDIAVNEVDMVFVLMNFRE